MVRPATLDFVSKAVQESTMIAHVAKKMHRKWRKEREARSSNITVFTFDFSPVLSSFN